MTTALGRDRYYADMWESVIATGMEEGWGDGVSERNVGIKEIDIIGAPENSKDTKKNGNGSVERDDEGKMLEHRSMTSNAVNGHTTRMEVPMRRLRRLSLRL
ncbi:hypothetical protein SERLADRAFT_435718 [Serpula lacrymans var. lacrymans S7.9]|uniref:Uncharacterized protein n=1 Tax=Serpula lacrymans var. lacrymans (strain S7.9) TaxID=578457 RepID=F8NMW4_SERL9|nr:uncharacterized protein SERLADRAFT_435718 [Serpula lacrymans var. lacrymans S7.9]EGO27939.1 hypothetical protein SERLADRAFT_435718 [Serpula lacrymans var. lacrymans S7.9]